MTTLFALGALIVMGGSLQAQDAAAHFKKVEVPLNEWRANEMARVREFRCEYELPKASQGALLVAEYYENGKHVGTFHLSRFKFSSAEKKASGTISIGWRYDSGNVVSAMDDGERPWTSSTSLHLEGFKPEDCYLFKDSQPVKRKAQRKDGAECVLYPVIGVCGERKSKLAEPGADATVDSYLQACAKAQAKSVVIIYLYQCELDEEPGVRFMDK